MKKTVGFFTEYYKAISNPIKEAEGNIDILDLGCGTGLEIEDENFKFIVMEKMKNGF